MTDIAAALLDIPGAITVSGHTDDTQVNSELFANNWDLSARRAVAVASVLEKVNGINATRIQVMAFADKKPLVANTSVENRRINRRVEIAIAQGKAKQAGTIELID